jgi:hypothetical protein
MFWTLEIPFETGFTVSEISTAVIINIRSKECAPSVFFLEDRGSRFL